MQSKNRLFRLTWVVVLRFNMIWVFTKESLLLLFTFSQKVLHSPLPRGADIKGSFRHANTHIPHTSSLTHPQPQNTHQAHRRRRKYTHHLCCLFYRRSYLSFSICLWLYITLRCLIAGGPIWVVRKMWERRQREKEIAPAAGQMGVLPLFQILL